MTLSLYKCISHNILQIFLSLFLDQITAFTFGIGVFFQDCTIAVSISSPNPLTFISMPWIFDPFPYNPFPLFLIVYSIFTKALFFCHHYCFISSVRSSYSHPDLLVIHHPPTPLFQITPVLDTGLSLSEPLQLYKGYNAI